MWAHGPQNSYTRKAQLRTHWSLTVLGPCSLSQQVAFTDERTETSSETALRVEIGSHVHTPQYQQRKAGSSCCAVTRYNKIDL